MRRLQGVFKLSEMSEFWNKQNLLQNLEMLSFKWARWFSRARKYGPVFEGSLHKEKIMKEHDENEWRGRNGSRDSYEPKNEIRRLWGKLMVVSVIWMFQIQGSYIYSDIKCHISCRDTSAYSRFPLLPFSLSLSLLCLLAISLVLLTEVNEHWVFSLIWESSPWSGLHLHPQS